MTEATALLTLDEAAGLLDVSRRTLERLTAAGRIRPVRIGRRRLVTTGELEAFVAGQRERHVLRRAGALWPAE